MIRARTRGVALAGLLAVGCSGGGDPVEGEPAETAPPDEPVAVDVSQSESERVDTHPVRVFFPSSTGNGLVGETREIFDTATPGERIKQILSDLIAGPAEGGSLAALPQGTSLRQVWVLDDGTAYLDFSGELADGLAGGSRQEMLTVYSIVDSVILNVPEVSRVAILVGGRTVDTLNGHLDLRRPFTPDRGLIVGD